MAAVLSDGRLAVVECVEEDLWEETLEEQLEKKEWDRPGVPRIVPRILRLPRKVQQDVAVIRHVAWVSKYTLLLVASPLPRNNATEDSSSSAAAGDVLVEIDVRAALQNEEEEEIVELSGERVAEEMCCFSAPGPVVCCACCAETSGAVLQIEGGALWGYQPSENKTNNISENVLVSLPSFLAFPSTCFRMLAIPSTALDQENNFQALGLNAKGELWWGSRQLAAGITSFILRYTGPGGPMLLYTTRNHMLRTLPLAKALKNALSTAGAVGGSSAANTQQQQQQQQQQNQAYAIPELKLIQQMQQQQRRNQDIAAGGPIAALPKDDVTLRTIEEGSLLVASPADGVDAIYQAPRGNLETARPRALVLPAVAAALDQGDYASAWRLATVDRLDLNVLADFKWPRFLGQAVDLVNAVGSDVEIADFVALLAPGSVTGAGGLYEDALAEVLPTEKIGSGALLGGIGGFISENGNLSLHHSLPHAEDSISDINTTHSDISIENKVPAVCEAIRAAVLKLSSSSSSSSANENENEKSSGKTSSSSSWLRTEVTTYSKCGDLEKALKRVKQVKEAELEWSSSPSAAAAAPSSSDFPPPSSSISASAEQGLKHLLLYNLEEDVYRAALGSYELEMAYMVVTYSQRDPGEFLYQLQQFASIENESMRYHAIDMHLKRYDSALRHLMDTVNAASEQGNEEESKKLFSQALKLAQDHSLLRLLLQLTQGKPELRCQVHIAAGEELEQRGKHEDAALAFIAAGDLEKALRAYRLGGQWRQALGLAARLGRDPEKIQAMAARLASDLADLHNYAHSAQILLEYLNDVPGAVAALTEGGQWTECIRVAYSRDRPELVESKIAPAAAMAASRILASLNEDCARIEKYSTRLKELSGKREAMAATVQTTGIGGEFDFNGGNGDEDMQTEADSMISGMSIYTDATFTIKPGGSSRVGGGSTASVTTVGGRRSSKKRNKGKNRSNKVRQGSPEEEAQLGRHLLSLAPLPGVCTEVGQLVEVLVMLGHEEDAVTLHRSLKTLIDAHAAAVEYLLAHPPLGMSLDIGQRAKERAFEIGGGFAAVAAVEAAVAAVPGAELQKRAAEVEMTMKETHWKWDILRDP